MKQIGPMDLTGRQTIVVIWWLQSLHQTSGGLPTWADLAWRISDRDVQAVWVNGSESVHTLTMDRYGHADTMYATLTVNHDSTNPNQCGCDDCLAAVTNSETTASEEERSMHQ